MENDESGESEEIDEALEHSSDIHLDKVSIESDLNKINGLIRSLKNYNFICLKEPNSLYKLRFMLSNRLEEIGKRDVNAVCINRFLVKRKVNNEYDFYMNIINIKNISFGKFLYIYIYIYYL